MGATVIDADPQAFTDPEGREIEDSAIVDRFWENGFTQDDINRPWQ